jgi:hypothetical protein
MLLSKHLPQYRTVRYRARGDDKEAVGGRSLQPARNSTVRFSTVPRRRIKKRAEVLSTRPLQYRPVQYLPRGTGTRSRQAFSNPA